MELAFWIGIGALLSLGLLELIGYFCRWMLRPRRMYRFYTMIPISGHMEDAEQILRWAFSTMRWDYWSHANWLLILDLGADEETLEICRTFCSRESGASILTPHQLLDLMEGTEVCKTFRSILY